ncbi:MAG: DNA repair protein RadA [Bradymonadaceae bacterium]|nr:DNA repair protein RadA [Lujinxingiaceae bacterium]
MAKTRSIYVCQNCAHESARWLGRCPGCEDWNSFVEELRGGAEAPSHQSSARAGFGAEGGGEAMRMGDVSGSAEDRILSGISELDRVLGGGFVHGGVVLLGGDPGIGKSTLSLQVAGHFASAGNEVLYISGEESLKQLKMRAERLNVDANDVLVLCETSLERVEKRLRERPPRLLILDSIQTLATDALSSSPGSVAQLREVTAALTQLAKGLGVPTVLVGHVTKDGNIAGPKVLEHMVDTVLYFEGQSGLSYRILRAVKNRYGSTNEIGVFEMRGDGLHEVLNPSEMFLAERPQGAPGSVVVPVVEGSRPLLVELQALISPTSYGPPRITAVGVEHNRVLLLLNIIEKRTGLKVAGQDVFVNVAGGVRVAEPAVDLGIVAAVLSSYLERPVPQGAVCFGEVGLTGEVRAVSMAPARLAEAQKLGFTRAALPRGNAAAVEEHFGAPKSAGLVDFHLDHVRTLADAIRAIFGKDVL